MLLRNGVRFVDLAGLLSFVLAACTNATSTTDPRTQPPLVRIEAIKTSSQAERSFSGIVAARVQSDLGFRVPGKILERLVDTGQTVKRGQPLMRIDPKD
jgi:multidrug efflux pump subunit AcrA (membrane-fusion protein)